MEGKRLSLEEINKRLVRLRNVERLYEAQKIQNKTLKELISSLKEQIALLLEQNKQQDETITNLTLQVAELRAIVFGRKYKKKKKDDTPDEGSSSSSGEKLFRSKDSYKRPVPNADEITGKKHHAITKCTCGHKLLKKETAVYYEEDIPLPIKKIVIEHTVEKGYCPACRKWHSAIPIPSTKVIIGIKTRKLINILSVVNRSSYSQIESLLEDVFSFKISQGEIAKILVKEANHLRPAYEQLLLRIRNGPVKNIDETGWRLFKEDASGGNYAWVLTNPVTKEHAFLLGKNRGKGNIEKLLGEHHSGYTVSDDYGAYDSLKKSGKHQLCFAHPLRKFRDLAESDDLKEEQLTSAKKTFRAFSDIYKELRIGRDPKRHQEFKKRLHNMSEISPNDPTKLARLKSSLRKNIPSYLTCFSDDRIPLDNNQAERSLRHLVLKRKISFGSQNKNTAENLAILLSVIMSLKQTARGNFFEEYLGM